jgi:cytochrome c oxidase assembly protein subunit 15
MTLNEFKIIFLWEYAHRMLGRIIGLFFIIPLVYFYFNNKINKKYLFSCCIILFLIIFQGVVGWYMVKSGLVNNVTVSHYRLSLHLTIALIIISLLFWNILNYGTYRNEIDKKNKNIIYFYYLLFFLILLQVVLGAFVSGLDAGRIYQTWPLMNLSYFPDELNINYFTDFFNFDSHALVQFYHRNLAYLISCIIFFYGLYIFKKNIFKLKKPFYLIFSILLIQIFLGVTTLLSGLNIYLASAHQICSVLLLLSAINLYFCHIK